MQQRPATAQPQLDLGLEVVRVRLHTILQTDGIHSSHFNGEPGNNIQM